MDLSPAHLAVAPVLIPLFAGALMLFFDDRERRLKSALSFVSILSLIAVSVMLIGRVHGGEERLGIVYLLGNWPAPIAINLVADRLSSIMLALTAFLALPAVAVPVDADARRDADRERAEALAAVVEARYGLRIDVAACTVHGSWIGGEAFPYRWCPVAPAPVR